MVIQEFLFRKDSRTVTVPFPAKPIHSVKCTDCGFDGLASQLKKSYGNVRCPVCDSELWFMQPIHYANGETVDADE
jgi:predicted Zn-ribbon and HTH transcriptional regulator